MISESMLSFLNVERGSPKQLVTQKVKMQISERIQEKSLHDEGISEIVTVT